MKYHLLTLDLPEAMQHNQAPFPLLILEPHVHPKCTCSFKRLWCPSLNEIRASPELFIHKFLILMVIPIFCIWTSQLQSPQVYSLHPSPTLWNKSRRHMTLILSCNRPQYGSHRSKQQLLNTTNKISNCFFSLFHTASTRIPHSPNTPTSKSYSFQQLAEDLQRTFPSLGPHKKILNLSPCTQNLYFLIYIKNKKIARLHLTLTLCPWSLN